MIEVCVYWHDPAPGPAKSRVFCTEHTDDPTAAALSFSSSLRKAGARFVSICAENSDQVGSMGVDAVVNGKLPDGTVYDWKKRR